MTVYRLGAVAATVALAGIAGCGVVTTSSTPPDPASAARQAEQNPTPSKPLVVPVPNGEPMTGYCVDTGVIAFSQGGRVVSVVNTSLTSVNWVLCRSSSATVGG